MQSNLSSQALVFLEMRDLMRKFREDCNTKVNEMRKRHARERRDCLKRLVAAQKSSGAKAKKDNVILSPVPLSQEVVGSPVRSPLTARVAWKKT